MFTKGLIFIVDVNYSTKENREILEQKLNLNMTSTLKLLKEVGVLPL